MCRQESQQSPPKKPTVGGAEAVPISDFCLVSALPGTEAALPQPPPGPLREIVILHSSVLQTVRQILAYRSVALSYDTVGSVINRPWHCRQIDIYRTAACTVDRARRGGYQPPVRLSKILTSWLPPLGELSCISMTERAFQTRSASP